MNFTPVSLCFVRPALLLCVVFLTVARGDDSVPGLPPQKPEAVRAMEIEIMEKVADLALIPPVINSNPLPKYALENLDYGMTIGIARTSKGRIWACWVAGGDSPEAFFVLASSDDDGASWSQPRFVVDSHSKTHPVPRSILVGNLWTDPQGQLWLIFDQSMEMFDGRAGVWVATCENPDADQPVWSEPRRIFHGVTLNKPTVLKNGDWLLPISVNQHSSQLFQGCFAELDPIRGANAFLSKDHGKTWQRLGAVKTKKPDWHEHMFVERQDGSIWMLLRAANGIMESVSKDGGRTWSEPVEPKQIRHPNARFHVRRLASGKILLIKHGEAIDSHKGRTALSAWLSEDDGVTWGGGLVIDERSGISYPDGFQSPDGAIYISYDRNRSTDGEILLARFTEEDIQAKKIVSPQGRLKTLISKPLKPKTKAKTK